jgi:hypothetical protein
MATLTARRWNPAIKQFFERLIAAGKPFNLNSSVDRTVNNETIEKTISC